MDCQATAFRHTWNQIYDRHKSMSPSSRKGRSGGCHRGPCRCGCCVPQSSVTHADLPHIGRVGRNISGRPVPNWAEKFGRRSRAARVSLIQVVIIIIRQHNWTPAPDADPRLQLGECSTGVHWIPFRIKLTWPASADSRPAGRCLCSPSIVWPVCCVVVVAVTVIVGVLVLILAALRWEWSREPSWQLSRGQRRRTTTADADRFHQLTGVAPPPYDPHRRRCFLRFSASASQWSISSSILDGQPVVE